MSLFSHSKPQSYLGVDLGMSGMKVVELLNERGRARLVTYAHVDYANGATESERSFLDQTDAAGALLKKVIAKARATTKVTVAALPVSSVFSSIITVPAGNDKELKEAVQWQAKKLIPMPLEEIALDSKVLDEPAKESPATPAVPGAKSGPAAKKKTARVLLTGAPSALVSQYVSILTSAGLEPLALETEALAQIRALVGKDRATVMVIDIGSFRTNIIVVEKGIPFLSRSIATGGRKITSLVAQTLGIPFSQAEIMKKDIQAMQAFAPTGDLSPMLQTLLKPILDEIKYSFSLYQGQQSEGGQQKRIEKIIVTGGSALLPRLPEFLTQVMNVNAFRGDPWARVVYPEDLRPVLEDIGSRFSVAVGCAMRDIE